MPQALVTMQATLATLLSRFSFRLADQASPLVLRPMLHARPAATYSVASDTLLRRACACPQRALLEL